MPKPAIATGLAALADQCVMCGLCLPACPTYAASREEGESPRGRIALIKAFAEDRLPVTDGLVAHLDSCLACRRCEAVCPAGVRYGELIAGARALPLLRARRPSWRAGLNRWLTRPRRLRTLLTLRPALRVLKPWWSRSRSAWARRARFVAELPAPVPAAAPAATAVRTQASIVLFRGCIADSYEVGVRAAAARLFTALGERVIEAETGLCCGSLAHHAGDAGLARVQEQALLAGLRRYDPGLILGSASGCQARLREVLVDAGLRTDELHGALATHPKIVGLSFAALPARVAVHRPCSQRQLGGQSAAAVRTLLGLIPALTLVELPEQDRCCGAAGSQFLSRPEQAERLRAPVLADIAVAAPELLVSTNIGCRLFLDGGLAAGGRKIPVLHPVELLARQLLL